MSDYKTIGFIGLGVMGEPICRNLVNKSGSRVIAFDLSPEPLARLHEEGADIAGSVAVLIRVSEIVFLCLPSSTHVRAVFEGDGILKNIRAGQVVVDLGTSSVSQTRDFAKQLQAKGASWADAPIARTRQAAQDGTLSVMVGAPAELYAAIEPLIRCFATDVTRCGDVGAGQVTKNSQQHGAVRNRQRAVRGGRNREAQWRRSETSARHLVERLRRQLCAAQPRHEGNRPRCFPRTRVLDRICAQGSVLRAGTGR